MIDTPHAIQIFFFCSKLPFFLVSQDIAIARICWRGFTTAMPFPLKYGGLSRGDSGGLETGDWRLKTGDWRLGDWGTGMEGRGDWDWDWDWDWSSCAPPHNLTTVIAII